MITDAQAKKNIAANVSRLLDEKQLSQTELAKQTKESRMTIWRLCSGLHVPSAALLARIAEVLGTNLDALMSQPPKNNRRTA